MCDATIYTHLFHLRTAKVVLYWSIQNCTRKQTIERYLDRMGIGLKGMLLHNVYGIFLFLLYKAGNSLK